MKISLIGNCQTMALTWYLQQLNPNFDVKWIQFDQQKARRIKRVFFRLKKQQGKFISVISDEDIGIKRLNESDYVIFQHLQPETSKNYHLNALKDHAKHSTLISISSMHFDPNDTTKRFLKGMIERAEKFNIDIPAHKIIERHGSKIEMQSKTKFFRHPKVFYFLELVREICTKTGWDYYSDEQYNQYLTDGYPFG